MASIKYQLSLLKGLLTSERAFAGPFYVHIDITHRCNLKCLCCRWHSPLIDTRRDKSVVQDISPSLFRELCRDLRKLGTKEIYFVGTGEPFLHPRILNLIETAKAHGFKLLVYTNGLRLPEDTLRRLIDSRLDVLRVSLWASSADDFAKQVAGMNAEKFESIIEAMARLSELKSQLNSELPFLELCHTVTDRNIDQLDDTVALARRTSCDKMCFSPIVDFSEEELKEFVPDRLHTEKARRSFELIKSRLDRSSIAHNIDTMLLHYERDGRIYDTVPCYPAWYFTYVRTDGKIFACQRNTYATPPLGDLEEKRFEEIWNDGPYRKFRRQVSTCAGLKKVEGYYCDYCSHSYNSRRVHERFRPLASVRNAFNRILS